MCSLFIDVGVRGEREVNFEPEPMKFRPDKVTVVEADAILREYVVGILTDAGFQVFAEPAAALKHIVESMPDVIVLGANPPQLDCCDLLADVKGSERTRQIRVIMVSAGASAERVRGLELGAGDVLSLPINDHELLARVRARLREKRPEDELRETLHNERQSRQQAPRLLDALSQGRRTLRCGIISFIAVALVATGIIALLSLRSQKQNVRVYAALTKLQTSLASERGLIEQARIARKQAEQSAPTSSEPQRQPGNISGLNLKVLIMDDGRHAAISGEPVVLLGYPTGINAILARSSEDALRSMAAKANGDSTNSMTELARQKLIRPVSTQGHIGDVLADKIIYDAQTASGGSGGPLFNSAGKVIAINVAILRDFAGSNFAIPVRFAKRLLVHQLSH
jgi:CheY-like chemotaxis protein